MTSVTNVAKYIIKLGNEREDNISNLKLQKMLYYSQGFSLAINDEPLFPENILAWTHGPVVESIYHEYKQFSANTITLEESISISGLTNKDKDIINEVYDVYGQFSAWKLRNMTHEEKPWLDHEESADVITQDELKTFFKTKIK